MTLYRHVSSVLFLLLFLAADAHPEPYNLLFVSLDTVRADRLSCYGYARQTSPNIDALAARGTLFTDCLSPLPLTLPAHSTMLTGLHPSRHGLLENNYYADDKLVFLQELASEGGYETRAFVGAPFLTDKYNFTQGFAAVESFIQYPLKVRGGETAERFERWLLTEYDGEKPFFSFVHFYDVHEPYGAPPPYENVFSTPESSSEQMVLRDIESQLQQEWNTTNHYPSDPHLYALNAKYDEGIVYVDQQVNRLLKILEEAGVSDKTIVVVTADHGEGLGDFKNDFYHGASVFQNTLHVPLIIVHPGIAGPARNRSPVALADLFPTCLQFMGLDNPGTAPRAHELNELLGNESVADWTPERLRFARSGPDGGANSRYNIVQNGTKLIVDERTDAVSWWRLPLDEPLRNTKRLRLAVQSSYRAEMALEIVIDGRKSLLRFGSVDPEVNVYIAWQKARAESDDGWIQYLSPPLAELISEEDITDARAIGLLLNLGSASRYTGVFDSLEFEMEDGWRMVRPFELADQPLFEYAVIESRYSAGTPDVVEHAITTEFVADGNQAERISIEFPDHPFARSLYQLDADPWEIRNIFPVSRDAANALEPQLRSFFSAEQSGISQERLEDTETMQELESLGYL